MRRRNAMDEHLKNLYKVLEKEYEMYGGILQCCQGEQKDIISGNIESIDKATQQKEKILKNIATLEKYRRAFVSKLGQGLKIHPRQLTISKLIQHIPDAHKEAFQTMEGMLQTRLAMVKEVNESNAELLKTSLDCIEFTLNLFSNKTVRGTYDDAARQPLYEGDSYFLDKQV